MSPLISTEPTRAIGTLRRGFEVSSASGADASKPPNATTARLKARKMFVAPAPLGQANATADRPSDPPWKSTERLIISSTTTSIR